MAIVAKYFRNVVIIESFKMAFVYLSVP